MLTKLCCLSTDSCKGQCIGLSRNQNIKLTYIVLILLVFTISILKNYPHKSQLPSDQQTQKYHCTQISLEQQSACVSKNKTSIDMLSLSLFHFIIFVCLLPKTKHVKVINQGMWLIKLFLIIALLFIVQYTFGPSLSQYIELVSSILSSVLYLIISIIIIDNIYLLDFKFNSISQKYKKLHIVKVVLSIVFFLVSILLNIISYFYNQLWVCISTSVMIVLFLILTFLRISKNNTLFIYSIVMLHLTLITFTLFQRQQNDQQDKTLFYAIQHFYRMFILVLSIFLMLTQGGNQIRTKKSTVNELFALNTSVKQQDNRYVSSNKWIVYHFIIILITFAFNAVFNYDYSQTNQTTATFIHIGRIAWWVYTCMVYLWSIIVQRLYPEQDFSQLQNYFKQFQLN